MALKKIRCAECGKVIAHEDENGEITVLCKGKKASGERCNTEGVVSSKENPNKSK